MYRLYVFASISLVMVVVALLLILPDVDTSLDMRSDTIGHAAITPPAASPVADDGAVWRVYHNASLGFQFAYPANWSVRDQTSRYDPRAAITLYEHEAALRDDTMASALVQARVDTASASALLQATQDVAVFECGLIDPEAGVTHVQPTLEYLDIGGAFAFKWRCSEYIRVKTGMDQLNYVIVHEPYSVVMRFSMLGEGLIPPATAETFERMATSVRFDQAVNGE